MASPRGDNERLFLEIAWALCSTSTLTQSRLPLLKGQDSARLMPQHGNIIGRLMMQTCRPSDGHDMSSQAGTLSSLQVELTLHVVDSIENGRVYKLP